jgi:uncharacterized protein YcbX
MTQLQLSGITVYPVKAAAGVAATTWAVDGFGLRYDRRWVVTDPEGRFLTQRAHPRLALVRPTLGADVLRLEAPGLPPLDVPIELRRSAPSVLVTVWDDVTSGVRAGDDADRWVSRHLGTPSQLVYMPDDVVRPVDSQYGTSPDRVSFADGFPFLLVSDASLADLNRRLETPLPMNRFRPNLTVAGCAPFAEDGWRELSIGALDFRVVKPCARCVVTTTDQDTLARGKEPLRTLATYRAVDGKVMFGQNAIHAGTGELSVGDAVLVRR